MKGKRITVISALIFLLLAVWCLPAADLGERGAEELAEALAASPFASAQPTSGSGLKDASVVGVDKDKFLNECLYPCVSDEEADHVIDVTHFTYNGVTFTTAGTAVGSWGLNTGKYYDSNKDWRVYQNEGGTLTITAEAGKTIASVKITYNNKNGGVILHNEAQVTSGTVITVNANSLTIGVGSSSGATNGNIQITSIEIVYAE